MIKISWKGDFSKTFQKLNKLKTSAKNVDIKKYAREGVKALSEATPVRTGATAASWSYRIERKENQTKITWTNSNAPNGVPVAVLIQYGHGTRNGGYVSGIDYINPAMKPIFEKMAKTIWKEVTS